MISILLSATCFGAVISSQEIDKEDHWNVKRTMNKVATTGITSMSSGAVTTGAWATETHPDGCSNLSTEPTVLGYNLNKCQGNRDGDDTSIMYTSCEMSGDMTNFTVYYNSYSTSAFCEGTPVANSDTYTGLVEGCSSGSKYRCATDLEVTTYGSPQHIGNWNTDYCGDEDNPEEEMEWNILSYSSCSSHSDCQVESTSYSYMKVCDDFDHICFHVDSIIDYKGQNYTYDQLVEGKEPECSVPHSPRSRGVVITTSCGKTVRVTDTHLIATTKGFRLAYSLKEGDVLFGDYDKTECVVETVEKEGTVQQYFGLNCVHSEVLVSGIRASTFGDFHTLPSWYMTYVGGMFGSDIAAVVGDYIAEWYSWTHAVHL